MNNIARPTVFFSAYPLKAFLGAESNSVKKESPGMHAAKKTAIRIFPMVNPYVAEFRITPLAEGKIPNDIELADKSWFNHYE